MSFPIRVLCTPLPDLDFPPSHPYFVLVTPSPSSPWTVWQGPVNLFQLISLTCSFAFNTMSTGGHDWYSADDGAFCCGSEEERRATATSRWNFVLEPRVTFLASREHTVKEVPIRSSCSRLWGRSIGPERRRRILDVSIRWLCTFPVPGLPILTAQECVRRTVPSRNMRFAIGHPRDLFSERRAE